METICIMREIYKAIGTFESDFIKVHKVCINEAMVLCMLSDGKLSATEIAEKSSMTASHASKVIRSVEEKGLVDRGLGDRDKRQMYFCLTDKGRECLAGMKCGSVPVPDVLRPIFETKCGAAEH